MGNNYFSGCCTWLFEVESCACWHSARGPANLMPWSAGSCECCCCCCDYNSCRGYQLHVIFTMTWLLITRLLGKNAQRSELFSIKLWVDKCQQPRQDCLPMFWNLRKQNCDPTFPKIAQLSRRPLVCRTKHNHLSSHMLKCPSRRKDLRAWTALAIFCI